MDQQGPVESMISEGVELGQQAATELHVQIPKCQRNQQTKQGRHVRICAQSHHRNGIKEEEETGRVRRSVNSSSSTTSAAVGGGGNRSLGNRLGLMELF